MPTGLTAKIYDGKEQSFNEFLLSCAKQFGAFIHMRDDDFNKPITIPRYDPYYEYELEKEKEALENFKKLTDTEIQKIIDSEFENRCLNMIVYDEEMNEREIRYDDMISHVTNWNPPSQDHIALKNFMLDQLEQSKKFDCILRNTSIKKPTIDEYKKSKIETHTKSIEYYNKTSREKQERYREKIIWIHQLLESIGIDPKTIKTEK